jgi:tetratricopeptide (TPR) repeat protein
MPASAREADANAEIKGSLSYLGTILGKRGRVDDALKTFAEATDLELRTYRNVEGLFQHRGIRFADLLLRLGRMDDARRLTEANLRICVDKGWQEEVAQCWSVLGEIATRESLFEQADEQLKAAEGIFRGGHTLSQIPRILLARGDLERRRRNWDLAEAAVEEALTLAAPRQMRLDHADALISRTRLALDRGAGDSGTLTAAESAANRASDDCDAARCA